MKRTYKNIRKEVRKKIKGGSGNFFSEIKNMQFAVF